MKNKFISVAIAALLTTPSFAQELVVWDWKSGDPVAARYFESAREAFKAKHPEADVSFVVQPHDQYYTILGTAFGSGEGPDVVLMHGGSQTQTRTDALTDVSNLADGFSGADVFSVDGVTYAVPLTIQGFIVYYNKALYADAGLDPESPPTTWEEMGAVCDAINAQGDVPCFALGNKEGFGGEFHVTMATANSFTDDDYAAWAAGDMAWSDPKVKAIVETWVEMAESGWIQDGANSTAKFMDEYEKFMRSDAAHTVGLLSDVAHWKQFDEFLGAENLGAFPLPTPGSDTTRLPIAGGIGWAISGNTEHPELSRDLVEILTDGEREAIFAIDTGALPGNPSVDTSALSSPTLTVILDLIQTQSTSMAHAMLNPAVNEEWKRQSQLLINGETDVDSVVAAMEAARAANN